MIAITLIVVIIAIRLIVVMIAIIFLVVIIAILLIAGDHRGPEEGARQARHLLRLRVPPEVRHRQQADPAGAADGVQEERRRHGRHVHDREARRGGQGPDGRLQEVGAGGAGGVRVAHRRHQQRRCRSHGGGGHQEQEQGQGHQGPDPDRLGHQRHPEGDRRPEQGERRPPRGVRLRAAPSGTRIYTRISSILLFLLLWY